MKRPTLKQLTKIGSDACLREQYQAGESSLIEMDPGALHYLTDAPGRREFARAVAHAVEMPLLKEIDRLKKAQDSAKEAETFTCCGRIWNRHKRGDPMPCAGDLVIRGLTIWEKNGGVYWDASDQACAWSWGGVNAIVGWYPANPEPKTTKKNAKKPSKPIRQIPLDKDDIQSSDVFRMHGSDLVDTVSHWSHEWINLSFRGQHTFKDLANNFDRRQFGSTEWLPCTKPAK